MTPFIDMHCDTLSIAMSRRDKLIRPDAGTMVNMERLAQANARCQFMAMFVLNPDMPHSADWMRLGPVPSRETQVERMHEIYRATLEQYKTAFRPCESREDYRKNVSEEYISTLLTLEDGAVIQKMDMLYHLHELGVRLITLTWNFKNAIGSPNSTDPDVMKQGLTHFGRDVVQEMNRLGMIVDVSHLSDGGFYDVAEESSRPFVASHSCTRELCRHPRNLTDHMIRTLADRGGICGLNFYAAFLSEDGKHTSRISDMCRHMEHLRQIGGENILALGSDFDGIDGTLEVGSPLDMEKLFDALKKYNGYSSSLIEKIAWRNAERVMLDCLPTR